MHTYSNFSDETNRVIALRTDVQGRWQSYSSSWHRTLSEARAAMATKQQEGFDAVELVPSERSTP